MQRARRLTTKETVKLLGVKPETVYPYVSCGQLTGRRGESRRSSTFDIPPYDGSPTGSPPEDS
ncbi:hypothetical protein [Streptomyces sp. NPDC102360]|uniref:hypothetical protein n=1 Tax=Streptomyces sp. NPDC102360 TaxID=3366160 RepID=UPI0037FAB3CA